MAVGSNEGKGRQGNVELLPLPDWFDLEDFNQDHFNFFLNDFVTASNVICMAMSLKK